MKLTEKQQATLNHIRVFCESEGYSPTIAELCTLGGVVAINTMHERLISLRKKGLITWLDNQPRTIRVVKEKAEEGEQ